jgi:hypothetical protein
MTLEASQTWTVIPAEVKAVEWGAGPWVEEPDAIRWVDVATRLPCLALRNTELGFWCGYVGVRLGHPLFMVTHDDEHFPCLRVHGHITFTRLSVFAQPFVLALAAVAAEPAPEDDVVWWCGFHCGNEGTGDFAPGRAAMLRSVGSPEWLIANLPVQSDDTVYQTLDYVQEQCTILAYQLARIGGGGHG